MSRRRGESDDIVPERRPGAVHALLRPDFGTTAVPTRLPRGNGRLPPDVAEASQRARLMNAVAYVVAEKGYAATSVSDLTSHAGISRTTFYQMHKDKEDCFLYCFDQCSRAHLAAMLQAAEEATSLPQRLWDLLATHLNIADTNPWFARTFIVEAQVATPASQAGSERARETLTRWLEAWFADVRAQYPTVPARQDLDFTLVQEAVSGHVVSCIRHGRPLSPMSAAMTRFVFDALGLHGWAAHVARAEGGFGTPLA